MQAEPGEPALEEQHQMQPSRTQVEDSSAPADAPTCVALSIPDGVRQTGDSKVVAAAEGELAEGAGSERGLRADNAAGNVSIQTEADALRPQSGEGSAAAAVRVLGGRFMNSSDRMRSGLFALVSTVARAPAGVARTAGSDEVTGSPAAEAGSVSDQSRGAASVDAAQECSVSLAISTISDAEWPVTVSLRLLPAASEKGADGASGTSCECSKLPASRASGVCSLASPSTGIRPEEGNHSRVRCGEQHSGPEAAPAPASGPEMSSLLYPATVCRTAAAAAAPVGDELSAEERRALRQAAQIADQLRQVCRGARCDATRWLLKYISMTL